MQSTFEGFLVRRAKAVLSEPRSRRRAVFASISSSFASLSLLLRFPSTLHHLHHLQSPPTMLVQTLLLAASPLLALAAPSWKSNYESFVQSTCPTGYTRGSVTNVASFPVSPKSTSPFSPLPPHPRRRWQADLSPLAALSKDVDSFFDAEWEGFTVANTTGKVRLSPSLCFHSPSFPPVPTSPSILTLLRSCRTTSTAPSAPSPSAASSPSPRNSFTSPATPTSWTVSGTVSVARTRATSPSSLPRLTFRWLRGSSTYVSLFLLSAPLSRRKLTFPSLAVYHRPSLQGQEGFHLRLDRLVLLHQRRRRPVALHRRSHWPLRAPPQQVRQLHAVLSGLRERRNDRRGRKCTSLTQ
jgi:hypothetical protein